MGEIIRKILIPPFYAFYNFVSKIALKRNMYCSSA